MAGSWEHTLYFEAARSFTEQRFSQLKSKYVAGIADLTTGSAPHTHDQNCDRTSRRHRQHQPSKITTPTRAHEAIDIRLRQLAADLGHPPDTHASTQLSIPSQRGGPTGMLARIAARPPAKTPWKSGVHDGPPPEIVLTGGANGRPRRQPQPPARRHTDPRPLCRSCPQQYREPRKLRGTNAESRWNQSRKARLTW